MEYIITQKNKCKVALKIMYSETLKKLLNRVLTLVSKCTDDISLELDCFRDVEILSAASSNLLEFMKVSYYDCMKFFYILTKLFIYII